LVPEHISTEVLEQYGRRVMSSTDILAVDDHLAVCEDCRDRVRAPVQMKAVVSDLRASLRAGAGLESDHLSYEQIVALVDGEIDETGRDALQSHLEICVMCTEDVGDLRVVRSELIASSVRESTSVALSTWPQKIRAFAHGIRFPLRPAVIAALAILLVSASVALFLAWRASRLAESPLRAGGFESPHPPAEASAGSNTESVAEPSIPQPDVRPKDPEIVLALNDVGGRVTLDTTGNVSGLGSLPQSSMQAVKQAITTGRLDVPPLSELIGKQGTLLGTQDGDGFSVLSPVGTITRTGQPTLRWRRLSGATSYTVSILDTDFSAVANSHSLTTTSWTPTRTLERGRVYLWQVTAVKDGREIISPTPPAPEARFKVLDKAKADELSSVERVADSHLARGTIYARAGLLDDAERELRALLAANPNSPTARQLLQSVRAARRR
jgi:anti-sigma factor ChrR (cupin superfamily)